MFADVGNVPAVITKDGEHDRSYLWIFALVIIFAFLVLFRRDGRGEDRGMSDAIAPAATLAAMNFGRNRDGYGDHEHWDIVRDELREFGNVKKEISETGWKLTREMDQNYFQLDKNVDSVKHQNAVDTRVLLEATNASERRIMDRLAYDREKRLEDELHWSRMREGNMHVIGALSHRPSIYGSAPPAQFNNYYGEPNSGYGYAYGY